jgi:hypothetical protein
MISMTPFLLISLIFIDLLLIGLVLRLSRKQVANLEILNDMTEERRLLTDLRQSVRDELASASLKAKETLERAARLAAEAELEVRSGGQSISKEVEAAIAAASQELSGPLQEFGRKQAGVETLLRRLETEKTVLLKLLARGEKLCQFFDERVPYEEVLAEIEDKKYADARALLARGKSPKSVAQELGLSESEVRLVAGLSSI